MPETLTDQQAQDFLNELVAQTAYRRARLYAAFKVGPDDTDEERNQKAELLIQTLHRWSECPLAFIEDVGWAPDPKGRFGSGHIPRNLGLPAKSVPIIPYPAQKELILKFPEMLDSPTESALAAVKSRQVAFTTIFMWLAIWAWLFRPNGQGIITSYAEDLVDTGGKGQRTTDTLFGRLRNFLDAIVTCIPALRFNQNARAKKTFEGGTECGLTDSQDVKKKLTRPDWIVHGVPMFPEAKGNFLVGDIPGDSFGRGHSVAFVMMDEIGQYLEIGAGRDRKAWAASVNAAKARFAWGTIPMTGGQGSFFYELMHTENPTIHRMWVHWSDIAPYMAGAEWVCRACGSHNPHPTQPGPGPKGQRHVCETCSREQKVQYHDMTSPWFRNQCNLMLHDKIAIARELQMDWMAAQGDVLFSTLDHRNLVIPYRDSPTNITIEGFDPGQSMKNAGSWICARFCPKSSRLAIIGYWMGINPHPEYWVPFMKHWDRRGASRNRIMFGKFAGQTFMQAFDYPEDALRVMDHVYSILETRRGGIVNGDKYGSHGTPGRTTYDVFYEYGIDVDWQKTPDRADLVRNGIEWAPRMSVDEVMSEVEPPTPFGGHFPSITTVFQSAKPKPMSGEGAYKLDVSKQDPPHCHNAVDAWLYLVRDLDQVHSVADAAGQFSEDPVQDAECFYFGDDMPGT